MLLYTVSGAYQSKKSYEGTNDFSIGIVTKMTVHAEVLAGTKALSGRVL